MLKWFFLTHPLTAQLAEVQREDTTSSIHTEPQLSSITFSKNNEAWYTSWETTPQTQSDTLYTKWKKTCHWYFVSFQWPEKNACPVNLAYRVQVLVESKSKKDGIASIWEKNEVGKKWGNEPRHWLHIWQRNKPRRGLEWSPLTSAWQ